MARKPVPRSLPALGMIHPRFRGIPIPCHRTATLVELLRQTIQAVRQPHAVPFYPMQQVVAFFGVSMKTVQCAYQQLQAAGLLSLQRGSQTTLLGQQPQPRHPVRGVVAIVIWLPGFRLFLDWQFFFKSLEDELSRHRLVADLILHEEVGALADPFVDQILTHDPDWIVWLNPNPYHRQLLNQFQDAGLRVVAIGDRPQSPLPGQKCFLSWARALRTGLEAWRRDGIRRVVIPGRRADGASLTHVAEQVLDQSGLTYSFHELQPSDCESIGDRIQRLPLDDRTGVLFDDDMSFGYEFRNAPAQLLDLLRRHRAIVGRPIDLPTHYLADIRVDALLPNWRRMAKRIAADIASEKFLTRTEPITFHAEWHPRIAANALLQVGAVAGDDQNDGQPAR